MEQLSISALDSYLHKAIHLLMEYGPKVLLALIVLAAGIRLINLLTRLVTTLLEKQKVDLTLRPFIINLLNWTLKIMLFLSAASMVGIETTSFVAIIGAAGLAIGLALQGTLANFAGGVLILLFKPYRVHDVIETDTHYGIVEEIEIFTTKILTPNNELVIVPNGSISNGSIKNYSLKGDLRIDLSVKIDYESDIKLARKELLNLMLNNPEVLKIPEPMVVVKDLGTYAIELGVRCFVESEKYWDVRYALTEEINECLKQSNIKIAIPKSEIDIIHGSENSVVSM